MAWTSRRWLRGVVVFGAIGLIAGGCARQRVDPTEAVFVDFERRVNDYMGQRRAVADSVGALNETASQAEIALRSASLAAGIQAARASSKPGDIFTTEIAAVFVTLIREEHRRRPPPVQEQREDAQEELPDFEPEANQLYPTTYPLATFPATLLPLLPQLPEELEYRLVGRHLILRDSEANLIVDVLRDALP